MSVRKPPARKEAVTKPQSHALSASGNPDATEKPYDLPESERSYLEALAYFCLEHNRPERAIVLYRALLLWDRNEPRLLLGLAFALLRHGRTQEALQVAQALRKSSAARKYRAFADLLQARAKHIPLQAVVSLDPPSGTTKMIAERSG